MKKGRNKRRKWKFKDRCLNFLKHNYIYIIMFLLVILRVGLGYTLGAWYGTDQLCDDLAMFNGLSPWRLLAPNELSLIKDLSFSLFLGISAVTNLPYTVCLSLLWVLAAFVVWFLVGKINKNKWVRFLSFVYILFMPVAFEAWGGLRIYRNSIIVPCIILTFSFALMVLIDLIKEKKYKIVIWEALFAGLFFAFTYFLKEDGVWLKICMLVILLMCFGIICYKFLRKKNNGRFELKKAIIWVMVSLIPFGLFFVWDNVYRGVNYAFLGVYEVNTRTEGALGKFVEKIYKIDSPNRNETIWAPYDVLEKVFEVSETLKKHPILLEQLKTTAWAQGDMVKNPLKKDYLTWAMRTELVESGLWTSEKDVNDMFSIVNNELEEALHDGRLKKTNNRIQLLPSAGGYTWDEITRSDLATQMWMTVEDNVWLKGYNIGFDYNADDFNEIRDGKILHMKNDVNISGERRVIANMIATVITWMYRIINTLLFIAVFCFIIYEFVVVLKNWKSKREYFENHSIKLGCAFASFMFMGVAFAYNFATAWFFLQLAENAEYNKEIFVFYRVGVAGILAMAYIFGIIGISSKKNNCKVK